MKVNTYILAIDYTCMSDSKYDHVLPQNVSKRKYSESIVEQIRLNPKGLRFSELRNELKISDATLSRNLKKLLSEGEVTKMNNKYYPLNGDLAESIFRKAMEVVHNVVRVIRYQYRKANEYDIPKLKVALSEILGISKGPFYYDYHKLVDKHSLLDLEMLLKAILEGTIKIEGDEYKKIDYALADFIERSLKSMGPPDKRDEWLNKENLRLLREIEEEEFERIGVLQRVCEGSDLTQIDGSGSWISIYRSLGYLKDNQIASVLERIVTCVENLHWKESDEAIEKNIERKAHMVLYLIKNHLLQDTALKDVIRVRAYEYFVKQIQYASEPDLSSFFSELRVIAIRDNKKESIPEDGGTTQ